MTLRRVVRSLVVLVPSSLLLLPLLLVVADGSRARAYPREIKPGCRYEGRRYQEGTSVGTSEPCLRCRCSEGALKCRLRVCPRLPSPPPSGCHVRSPGEDECCAELVCGEPRDVENMLRRAGVQTNAGAEDEKHAHRSRTEGCVHDGVRYGSGSAMMGSRRCEYCYCISGARRCIRPKCLLPLPGCTPLYAPHSCCPVAYNCTHHHPSTLAPDLSGNGCRVGERSYVEGEMVRDIEWKAACDNCFCAMGAIRCVPLACAPPLQGCSPIVREGQCCPSTYNCSGSIEVKAAQNYASYAFISKDYAKFRKETNFFPAIDQSPTSPPVEGRGHRVVEEQVSTGAIDLEEDPSTAVHSTAWPTTMETDIMDNEILIGTMDYKSTLEVTTAAAPMNPELSSNTESTTAFESTSTKDADSTTDSCATCSTNTFADRTTIVTTMTTEDPFSTDGTTISSPEWTTMLPELTLDNGNDENEDTAGDGNKNASENEDRNEDGATGTGANSQEGADIIEKNKATTRPFVISTDAAGDGLIPGVKSPENSTPAKRTEAIGKRPVTSPSSTILMPDDILVMNVTVKTNVSVGHIQGVTINPIRSIPPDVEAILNITHREKGEDYDYDYSEPTLPPSLPNVRIIPFVAADALVKGKDVSSSETGYPPGSVVAVPELRPTDDSGFYDVATQENRFSPPVETEGGFVPREPPYFDVPYRSTDLNLEIGAGVTVEAQIDPDPHRKTDDLSRKCRFEGMEYQHGAILPSTALCVICMCYYGEVVCSSEKCPPLKIGCRRINSEESCCGKVVCVEADESPTVVLDRADATAPAQRQPTVSPDPFRDVIKTEPAPDLLSLIEDMIPYLVERGITTSRSTTSMMASMAKTTAQSLTTTSNQLQHPPSFDFMEQVPLIRPSYDYSKETIDFPYVSKYGVNREVPQNTVSLTYEPKDRPPESAEIGALNGTASIELNRTSDGPSKNDVRPDDIAEQKLAHENVSRHDDLDGNSSSETGSDDRGESNGAPTEGGKTTEDAEDDTIFSLDSVLELLFSANASTADDLTQTTKSPDRVSALDGTRQEDDDRQALVVSSTRTEGLTVETEAIETSSKVLDNEIPMPVGAVLKLAGCNIYGRMYRVGRIITELSSACLECRCTEIGVQCKQLEC